MKVINKSEMSCFNKILLILLVLLSAEVNAQKIAVRKYPMVGDTLADHTFTDLINYPQTTAKISDFRGKWLILDFWGYTCSACIKSFPKMDSLSRQFKDKGVQLIMVGTTKSGIEDVKKVEAITKKLYKRLDMMYNLKFTVAFDSVLYLKHDVGALPQIFIIDPDGVIRVKTTHIDSVQVSALLAGKLPLFERSFSNSELSGLNTYNEHVPLLTNNGAYVNGGRDTSYIYRSLLVPQDIATMPPYNGINLLRLKEKKPSKPIKFDFFDLAVSRLYHLAYFGRSGWSNMDTAIYKSYSQKIINETGDIEISQFLKKRYAYSLTLPPEDSVAAVVMQALQQDLRRVFPYSARMEVRNMPVYEITVDNVAKLNKLLKDQSNEVVSNSDAYGGIWKVKNMEFGDFMNRTIAFTNSDVPVLNKTGIAGKFITVDFKSDLLSLPSVFTAMEKMGLKIEQHERPLKVIVLSK